NDLSRTITNQPSLSTPARCPVPPPWETSECFHCGEGIHLDAVHHSTLANNTVDHNAGGILITDETGPNHDNLITGNLVTENGYDCGITLASHRAAPGYGGAGRVPYGVFRNTVANNEASKNGLLVSGNGTGVGLFTSPGPTGINIHAGNSGEPMTGNVVTGNVIEREDIGVAISTSAQINVHLNDLDGGGVGIANLGTGKIDATVNWWGCPGGPAAGGC